MEIYNSRKNLEDQIRKSTGMAILDFMK